MGLETVAEEAHAVDTVTAVRLPEGADANAILTHARERYGVLFGRGIGRLQHTVVRIGHLGYTQPEMLLSGIEVLGRTLGDLGHPVSADAGLAAARRELPHIQDDDLTADVARRRGTR